MSATVSEVGGGVVDLREGTDPTAPLMKPMSVATAGHADPEFVIAGPSAPAPAPDRGDRRAALTRRRRLLVLSAIGLAVFLAVQHVAGMLMEAQRQRHLAHELTTPDRRIAPGEAAFLLQIPDIGVNAVVAEGASSTEMRGGPGHVIGTADLADGGNVVVLGRRSRFGAAFGRLDELTEGAPVFAQSRGGGLTRKYTVESTDLVTSESPRPLRSNLDRLTLITSGPGLLPGQRLVVVAKAEMAPPARDGVKKKPNAQIDVAALDERALGSIGVLAGGVVLALAIGAVVVGARRLRQQYRPSTVLQALVPVVTLLAIVAIIIIDSVMPTTL